MTKAPPIYCLDANVLIQAWQKYYSFDLCPDYWKLLNELGEKGRILLPRKVEEEILHTEDKLAVWLKSSKISILDIDGDVTRCLKEIYDANPLHRYLVDNTKQRSLADPWIIAHAKKEGACVVTKEGKVSDQNSSRIKIPNVCENMGIRWIDDFQFVHEVNIRFSCSFM
jgi:Domain of unknown function (DUF4411)